MRASVWIGTALALFAFAGNSLLARWAIGAEMIDAMSFGLVRIGAGAACLVALASVRSEASMPRFRDWPGVAALFVYIAGFSLAYESLDAGLGALILFGVVQVLVIGWSMGQGTRLRLRGILGLMLAAGGLLWLLRPDADGAGPLPLLAMVAAGMGWGAYTLLGRTAPDPLARTARNFAGAFLPALPLAFLLGDPLSASVSGFGVAALSGAVTSGIGYAVWYAVLPRLGGIAAGSSQLLVPPLTILLGALLLGEALGTELLAASAIILGGVALTLGASSAPREASPR